MSHESIWPRCPPLSGYIAVATPGTKLEREVHWMIYSRFSCPNTDGNSSAPKIFTLLTNEHRYSGCDSSRGLPPHTHYLKGFENEEMILIKEVMANTHAQTNTHTHTPLSVLTFWFCGTDLHRGENSCFLVFALILYLICCFKTTALDSVWKLQTVHDEWQIPAN